MSRYSHGFEFIKAVTWFVRHVDPVRCERRMTGSAAVKPKRKKSGEEEFQENDEVGLLFPCGMSGIVVDLSELVTNVFRLVGHV
jgi:hypothetical protein